MIYMIVFGFIWGLITSHLGLGWFDGDIWKAMLANIIPIAAVALRPYFK